MHAHPIASLYRQPAPRIPRATVWSGSDASLLGLPAFAGLLAAASGQVTHGSLRFVEPVGRHVSPQVWLVVGRHILELIILKKFVPHSHTMVTKISFFFQTGNCAGAVNYFLDHCGKSRVAYHPRFSLFAVLSIFFPPTVAPDPGARHQYRARLVLLRPNRVCAAPPAVRAAPGLDDYLGDGGNLCVAVNVDAIGSDRSADPACGIAGNGCETRETISH